MDPPGTERTKTDRTKAGRTKKEFAQDFYDPHNEDGKARDLGDADQEDGIRSPKSFKADWLRNKPPQGWAGDGFDTETLFGWARLLCTSTTYKIVRKGDWGACFDFMLNAGPKLCAWNLRYDAEAVLKHLGTSALIRLLAEEHLNLKHPTTGAHYSVDIVPWKMLRIETADQCTEVYDIAPFYGSRLERAANRFLGTGKLKNVDAARLNTDPEYWRARGNLAKIVEYCKRDAKLTNDLAVMISDRFVKLGGDFRKPYSVAYVAADILMRATSIPKLPDEMIPHAEKAFVGARFECLWRGRFPNAASYDIKSAYPAHLAPIEDAAGRWTHRKGPPHKDALHSVVRVECDIPPDQFPYLAPIPTLLKGRVIFPTGRFEAYVLERTFEKYRDLLTPLESWSLVPSGDIVRPYGETVEKLLRFREESDQLLKDAAKRGNNSLYGKLLNQRAEKKLVVDDGGDHWTERRVVIDGEPYRLQRVRKQGLLYNPLHAGLITEACRLQMWDAAMKRPERVLMIQADGLITDGPFLGKKPAQKAGDLGFVAQGDSVLCGSGLYEIKGYARRTRGVMFRSDEGGKGVGRVVKLKGRSWFTLLRGKRTEKVRFVDVRPTHLSEALRGSRYESPSGEVRNLGLKDTNVFIPYTRDLNVCRDAKRVWPDILQARRLLTERFRSTPIRIR